MLSTAAMPDDVSEAPLTSDGGMSSAFERVEGIHPQRGPGLPSFSPEVNPTAKRVCRSPLLGPTVKAG